MAILGSLLFWEGPLAENLGVLFSSSGVFLGCLLCSFAPFRWFWSPLLLSEGFIFQENIRWALTFDQCTANIFLKKYCLHLKLHFEIFHLIFVPHCLACSGWRKLSGKNGPQNTQRIKARSPRTQQQRRKGDLNCESRDPLKKTTNQRLPWKMI